MYDELVKRLREHNGWALNETLDEAADAIEELMRRCEQFQYMPPPAWIPVTERLPVDFEPVYAALRSGGRENWVIEVKAYDPYLTCPWGHIPLLEIGKAHVYAWMPRPLPEPPKGEI